MDRDVWQEQRDENERNRHTCSRCKDPSCYGGCLGEIREPVNSKGVSQMSEGNGQDRAIVKPQLETTAVMKPVFNFTEIQKIKSARDSLIQNGLVSGKDYGTVGNAKKESLFKPGAQQILSWYQCRPEFVILSEAHDPDRKNEHNGGSSLGLHEYRMRCDVYHTPTSLLVGSGVGSCSTMEAKYISRPNDLDNTVFKMGCKRALVDAVLNTFALSDRFTQDVEDMDEVPKEVKPQRRKVTPAKDNIEHNDLLEELRGRNLVSTSGYKDRVYIWTKETDFWNKPELVKIGFIEGQNKGQFFTEYSIKAIKALANLSGIEESDAA